MELLIGVLLALLALIVLAIYRLLKRYRNAQHIRPTRTCPFCEQGTLNMITGSGMALREGQTMVWYYQWTCQTCGHFEVADLLGQPVPVQEER